MSPPSGSGAGDEPITELLVASRDGDPGAAERVFAAVYDELRRIAHRERRRLARHETLSTTAVVHEAYLRLMHDQEVPWESRAHLLGTAAVAMRHLLVDRARARLALKRGAGEEPRAFDDEVVEEAAEASAELLALDQALGRLEVTNPRLAKVVELRFFGGLSEDEAGRVLGVDSRTVRRDWVKAKAFLHLQLAG
jgi:RNA polymerase sigma factor (TIGR02999 family)